FPPRDQVSREGQAGEEGEGFFGPRAQANPTGEAGLNRFVWNLRAEDATAVPGAGLWGGSTAGPVITPGKYQVKLTVAGKSYTEPLEIKSDPRIKATAQDMQKRWDLEWQIHNELDAVNRAINQMRDVKKQVDDLSKRVGSDPKNRAIVDAGK